MNDYQNISNGPDMPWETPDTFWYSVNEDFPNANGDSDIFLNQPEALFNKIKFH